MVSIRMLLSPPDLRIVPPVGTHAIRSQPHRRSGDSRIVVPTRSRPSPEPELEKTLCNQSYRSRVFLSRAALGPSHLSWNVATEREEEPHRLVARIGCRSEHAWAAAVDHGDAVRAAQLSCSFGDAAGSGAAVHPCLPDPELDALAHRCLGMLGPGRDHHRLDTARDRPQVVVGGVAFDLVGVWIDGEDVVAAVAQPVVDDIPTMVSRRARDAGDGDALVPEELGGSSLDCGHLDLLTGIIGPYPSIPRHQEARDTEALRLCLVSAAPSLASVKVRRMKDVAVVVMDVRERPDEGVEHEAQPRQNHHERDDEPEVHNEPPSLQLAAPSLLLRPEGSGDSVIPVRENRRLETTSVPGRRP